MCKSDSIFLYLQSNTTLKRFLKFISSYFFIFEQFQRKKAHHNHELRSLQYLDYYENILIVLSLQHFETSVSL